MPREYEREYLDESSDYKRKRRSDDDGSTGAGGGSGNGETHESSKEHSTNHGQGPPDGPPLNEKSNAYLGECLEEKKSIDKQYIISRRLLEDEIEKVMVSGRVPKPEIYANVYTEKPIRVSQKVVFPIKDFPKFNFVGKILGPKGNTLRQLQEATFCKMVVMGRNSMRDHAKEEELRNSGNPRFAHLNRDLHVEISTVAPPAEAYHRLACALSEIRKFMIPDANDEIRMEQMREIDGKERAYKKPHYAKPYAEHGAYNSRTPPPPSYEKANKTKVYSILEKARYVMEDPSYTMMKPHRSRDHELYEHHADYDRYATPPPTGLKHSSGGHHVPYEGASYERDYRREYHHQHASSYATAYAVQGNTVCESGRFSVNGICVQQFNFCPLHYIFLNGNCFPTSSGNCLKGQIWINNECCSEACILSCEITDNCPCCGKMNTFKAQSCNTSFVPPCNVLLNLVAPKPTSAPKPIVCPPGSYLNNNNGACLLVHCANGITRDGRCIRLQCPPGTFWFNEKCIMEKNHNYNITYNHSYNMEVNSRNPNNFIENVNDIYVNSLNDDLDTDKEPAGNWEDILKEDYSELANLAEFITPASAQTTTEVPGNWEEILNEDAQNLENGIPCCSIVSPRICKQIEGTKTWKCFNRKHEFCGEICQAKTICLVPAKSRQCRDYIVVVPPPKNITETNRENDTIDCSGCVLGDYNKCHKYCYHYSPCSELSTSGCQFLGEKEFCGNNTDGPCLKADASYDSLPHFA